MLSRVHQVLIGLLVVQILLVIVMRLHGGELEAEGPPSS